MVGLIEADLTIHLTAVDEERDLNENTTLLLATLKNFLVEQQKYLEESEKVKETDLIRYIQLIGELQNTIKWSTQPQMKFELGILKMAKMTTTVEIENLLERLDLLKKKTILIKNRKR